MLRLPCSAGVVQNLHDFLQSSCMYDACLLQYPFSTNLSQFGLSSTQSEIYFKNNLNKLLPYSNGLTYCIIPPYIIFAGCKRRTPDIQAETGQPIHFWNPPLKVVVLQKTVFYFTLHAARTGHR